MAHIPCVNQAADAHQPTGGALQHAWIIDDAGQHVMSVNALVARLHACTTRADLTHVTDVLATLASSAPQGAAPSEDRQAGLAEWDHAVTRHALADPTKPVATNEPPTVAEAQRIDSTSTSQRTIPGYLAAFSTAPAAVGDAPAQRSRPPFTSPERSRGQPGPGIHR